LSNVSLKTTEVITRVWWRLRRSRTKGADPWSDQSS